MYSLNGMVVIEDVMKDSPGDVAGFKAGDVIVSIDNDFSGKLQNYKNLLEVVGNKPRIVISRSGELSILYLSIIDISKKKK